MGSQRAVVLRVDRPQLLPELLQRQHRRLGALRRTLWSQAYDELGNLE